MNTFKELIIRKEALEIILSYSNLCFDCVQTVQRDLDWTEKMLKEFVEANPVII